MPAVSQESKQAHRSHCALMTDPNSPYPKKLSLLLGALPFLVTFTHVLVSPYTKVEESFTLHAVHDVYAHGADYKSWDYVQFPGAVPRSFVPSLLIALMNWPMVKLFTALGVVKTKLGVQILGTSADYSRAEQGEVWCQSADNQYGWDCACTIVPSSTSCVTLLLSDMARPRGSGSCCSA